MSGPLMQDYDAHILFTFRAIPDRPAWAHRAARIRRWFTIALAESWLAAWLFRAKVRLRERRVPGFPLVCDALSRSLFRVSIGDHVTIGPGLMITHGNVVIDGRTAIGRNCQISPWVTIGLSNSKKLGFSADGPTIGDDVHIGTGAKILGPVVIGDYARIGANAVVIDNVPANTTAVGAPARILRSRQATAVLDADGLRQDDAVVTRMREAIAGYKLHRQSLRSLVDTLMDSFEVGSNDLRTTGERLKDDLIFLDAVAATGGEESQQVIAAIDTIDGALPGTEAALRPLTST